MFFQDKKVTSGWFWNAILIPFLVTRLCWIITGYYAAGNYLPNPTYAKYVERGYFLTHLFPIDIFARWDSGAYFSILSQGYAPSSDIRTVFSNIAFFPLYPYLVKSIGWLGISLPDGFYVAFGVLLSNLFFLAAAVLLFRFIIVELGFTEETGSRTLGLLFVFPTAFIFLAFIQRVSSCSWSSWLSHSPFSDRWGLAAFTAFFMLLTRTQGLVAWGILLVLYLERKHWKRAAIRADFGWLLLAPAGFLGHLYYLYQMTGEPLAPFAAMTAWGRANTSILANLSENSPPLTWTFIRSIGFDCAVYRPPACTFCGNGRSSQSGCLPWH